MKEEPGAHVYMLRCSDGSYYVGSARRGLDRRISEHNEGECGVRFVQSDAAVWFLPSQLVRLATEKKSQNGG